MSDIHLATAKIFINIMLKPKYQLVADFVCGVKCDLMNIINGYNNTIKNMDANMLDKYREDYANNMAYKLFDDDWTEESRLQLLSDIERLIQLINLDKS
jgi:hypothetical protein